MSELFSHVMSLLSPKYERVTDNDTEWLNETQLKQQYRTGLRTLEEPHPVCTVLPVPSYPPKTHTDVHYTSHTTQTTDYPESSDNEAVEVAEHSHKTSDLANLVSEKRMLKMEDIFPSLNEILNDHGIKDKLKSLSISAKNKLQSQKSEEPTERSDSFFSKLRLTMPAFATDSKQKLYPLEQSKDKTVQTYYPGM